MSMYQGRLETTEDIAAKANIVDTDKDGATRVRVVCGPALDDVAAFGTQPPTCWPRQRSSDDRTRVVWSGGTPSYGAAIDMLKNGWREGTEKMRKLVQKLTPRLPQTTKPQIKYCPSVTPMGGFNFNPVAARSGMPAPYVAAYKTKRMTEGQKLFKIAVNVSASCGVSSEILEAKGSAILALIDSLQKLRKTVDVTVFMCCTGYDFDTGNRCKYLGQWHVMPAGVRMNMDSLAFALVNAGTLRRVMFALMEHITHKGVSQAMQSGYGSPASIVKNFPDVAAQYDLVVDSDVYIKDGKVSVEWTDGEKQVAWIKEQLRKQGIEC